MVCSGLLSGILLGPLLSKDSHTGRCPCIIPAPQQAALPSFWPPGNTAPSPVSAGADGTPGLSAFLESSPSPAALCHLEQPGESLPLSRGPGRARWLLPVPPSITKGGTYVLQIGGPERPLQQCDPPKQADTEQNPLNRHARITHGWQMPDHQPPWQCRHREVYR